ncbi:MAG: GGDEF domain-containing protein, partial [Psychrobium sp.]
KSDIDLSLRKYFSVNENNLPINEADIVFFLIDLDHFKQVNDLYGHAAGDSVLINIKEILNEVFRESDYLIRWGGEEFLVVARFSNRGCAPEIAERLRHLVESYNFDIGEGRILRKTCSIGFASFPFIIESPELMSWEQVVDIADHSLYAAKRSSRNCWVGLENIDCSADNIFDNVTNNTEELIKSNHLKSINSSKINGKLKWDNIN